MMCGAFDSIYVLIFFISIMKISNLFIFRLAKDKFLPRFFRISANKFKSAQCSACFAAVALFSYYESYNNLARYGHGVFQEFIQFFIPVTVSILIRLGF